MPKLSDDQRQSIKERLSRTKAITDSFKGRQWTTQHCGLCKWASNGRDLDMAVAASRLHEVMEHPESMAILESNRLSASELPTAFHDHDCVEAMCACRCGCQEGPFCILGFGPLCSSCTVRADRGHDECGEVQP